MTGGREYTRVFLTLCCIATLVLSAVTLPALSDGPTASVPGTGQSGEGQGDEQSGANASGTGQSTSTETGQSAGSNGQGGTGSGGGLGALSTGEQTTIGGDRSAFRSTGQQIHFTVRSTQPSYWRTNAYEEYTASGWEDQGELTGYDGGEVPGDTEGQQRVVQRYRLNRSGNSLPAAWRPVTVDGPDTDIRITDQQALKSSSGFEAGTTYGIVSYTPPRDPERLRDSARSYPDSIETQYTQLPPSTRDELEPFTRRIVDDPESPYDSAVRIEAWLEANKEYSLNASHDSGTDVATAFVFDMDRGYCEYFATAMVAMLRSQDIPARYVTGYSTGQPVGEDEYVVRGMNAHAWVEVYFEDVGWVRFDPTPGSERLDTEAQAYAEASTGSGGSSSSRRSNTATSEGSEAGTSEGSEAGTSDGSDTGTSDVADEYRHEEVGSPGETIGSPSGSESESPEGESDSSGTGTSEPDSGSDQPADSSQNAGESGDSQSSDEPQSSPSDEQSSGSDEQSSSDDSDTDDSDSDDSDSDDDANDPDEPSEDGSTEPIETELNRTELVPGTDVQVTVTRGNETVSGVTVLFNGDRVGTTDRAGTVVGTIPYTEELNVTVEPGTDAQSIPGPPPLERSSYFDIRKPSVSALHSPGIGSDRPSDVDTYEVQTNATIDIAAPPVPGSSVAITATINGTPLPGATVAVGDTNVTETNQSGRARITLPTDVRRTTVRVTRGDVRGQRETTLVTQLNVSVHGEFHPGGDARVAVTALGNSVENATVAVGGRTLGRTAGDGTVTGQFPETTGTVAATATKGVAEGTQSISLKRLTVTATPERGVAFPWTDVTVRSELENESVGGVAIQLNGRPIGETGPDGTLRATLPPTYEVTMTATGYGQRVTTTAGNPLLLLLGTVAFGLLLVGGAVRRGRRSERTVAGSITSALELGGRVGQRLFGAIVTLASRADSLVRKTIHGIRILRDDLAATPQLLRRWTRRITRRVGDVIDRIREIARRVTAWLVALARHTSTAVRNPKQSLRLLVGWIQRLSESDGSDTVGRTDGYTAASGATRDSDAEQESRLTVREAWREFLGYVSVRRWQTKTPGQISRRAIDSDGLPSDAVRLLTKSFRDVEYGNRSAQDKVTGAREALDDIKHASRGDEEDDDG